MDLIIKERNNGLITESQLIPNIATPQCISYSKQKDSPMTKLIVKYGPDNKMTFTKMYPEPPFLTLLDSETNETTTIEIK